MFKISNKAHKFFLLKMNNMIKEGDVYIMLLVIKFDVLINLSGLISEVKC